MLHIVLLRELQPFHARLIILDELFPQHRKRSICEPGEMHNAI